MRTPALSQEEAARAVLAHVGQPGEPVTSRNREHVQRWLTSSGVPSSRAKSLTLAQLTDAWRGRLYVPPGEDEAPEASRIPAGTQPALFAQPVRIADRQQPTDHEPEDMNSPATVQQAAAMLAAALANQQSQAPLDLAAVHAIADEKAQQHADKLDNDLSRRFADKLAEMAGDVASMLEGQQAKARDMVAELLASMPSASAAIVEFHKPDAEPVRIKGAHPLLADVASALQVGLNVALIGPAGCGKTHLAEQAAEALALPFYMSGAVDSRYELSGFRDAQGNYQLTPFREAFEHGGVFLADEMDASDAGAFLWLNSALANGVQAFPDGMIKRHADFRMVGAANTFGHGADRLYVGRNQLDAASLDRFKPQIEMDYDAELEARLCGNAAWAARVQAMRTAARNGKDRLVISMRASIAGARLLALGWDRARVEDACLFAGIAPDVRARLRNAA